MNNLEEPSRNGKILSGIDSAHAIKLREGIDPNCDESIYARYGRGYGLPLSLAERVELLAIMVDMEEESFTAKPKGSIHRIWDRIRSSSCCLKIMSVSGLMRRFMGKQ